MFQILKLVISAEKKDVFMKGVIYSINVSSSFYSFQKR